jgi:hypothetical protein
MTYNEAMDLLSSTPFDIALEAVAAYVLQLQNELVTVAAKLHPTDGGALAYQELRERLLAREMENTDLKRELDAANALLAAAKVMEFEVGDLAIYHTSLGWCSFNQRTDEFREEYHPTAAEALAAAEKARGADHD